MTLSRREKIMIVVGLVVVTLVAYIFYFLIPQMSRSQAANSRFATAQSQLNILKTKAAATTQLKDDIKNLNDQLKNQGQAIPTEMDHARILLYLKKTLEGKAVNVSVAVTKEPEIVDRFLLQAVTVEFRTSYPELLQIMDVLKKNELYGRVTYLKSDYAPAETANAETPGITDATGTAATESPAPTASSDTNVMSVHMEMNFFSLQPTDGEQAVMPLTPTSSDRSITLFPAK